MIRFIRIQLIWIVILIQGCAPGNQVSQRKLEKEATYSLGVFQEMVTDENYSRLGFKTPAEVKLISLGVPIQQYIVRLDHLIEYKEGSNPDSLLIDTHIYHFPVLVNDEVRSSIEILWKDKKYEAISYGSPKYIQAITGERTNQTKRTSFQDSDFILVIIPSLRLHFLGYYNNEQLILIPVFNYPQLDLLQGSEIQANKLFLMLAPIAQKHDGLPG